MLGMVMARCVWCLFFFFLFFSLPSFYILCSAQVLGICL